MAVTPQERDRGDYRSALVAFHERIAAAEAEEVRRRDVHDIVERRLAAGVDGDIHLVARLEAGKLAQRGQPRAACRLRNRLFATSAPITTAAPASSIAT